MGAFGGAKTRKRGSRKGMGQEMRENGREEEVEDQMDVWIDMQGKLSKRTREACIGAQKGRKSELGERYRQGRNRESTPLDLVR